MTDTDPVPIVGSRIGRYLIIREIAQGSLGPLFIAEREVGEGVGYGLARVVCLPSELPANDEQALADAIWDSTHLNHELALRVADVITGKGWITLIHEHSEGSLLSYLQTCAQKSQGCFPAKVASRIALDVIEGLEQSRDLCASAGIPWRSGSVSPGSLLLGPDGRMRAMDGQITAAAMRVPMLRYRPGVAAYAAPELLDDTREPNERADVFAVGVLLWELLTARSLFAEQGSSAGLGHGFKVSKVSQSLPPGTKVPQGLVHTVHTALEADPNKRQSSLRELAVAIVMGVEDVSTYEQVLEFTDGLLLASASDAPAAAAPVAPAPEPAGEKPAESAPLSGPAAGPVIFSVETPAVPAETSATPDPSPPRSEHVEQKSSVEASSAQGASALRSSSLDAGLSNAEVQDEVTGQRAALSTPEPPEPSRSVSTEVDSSSHREKLGTLPGHGDENNDLALASSPVASTVATTSAPSVAAAPVASESPTIGVERDLPKATEKAAPPEPTPSVPPPSAGPFRLVHDEPFVPIAIKPVQVIDGSKPSSPPAPQSSSRPPTAAPLVAAAEPAVLSAPPKRTVQLSVGTIVFGILTTVLAVVVVMLVLQQRSPSHAADVPAASGKAMTPAVERAEHQSAIGEAVAVNPGAAPAPIADAGGVGPAATKGDHHKHAPGPPNKISGKSTAPDSDMRTTEPKPTEQPTNRHFVPNEL